MKPHTEELLKYAEHQNPRSRMILETVVVTSEDVKDTKADWDDADSTTGWATLEEGGARPAGANSDKISLTTATGDAVTSMPLMSAASVGVVAVEWKGDELNPIQPISAMTANLDPDASGGGQQVTHYVAQLYRVAKVITNELETEEWELEAITVPKKVVAPVSAGNVTFTFPGVLGSMGTPPDMSETSDTTQVGPYPTTVVHIAALKGAGEVAGNVAWLGDTAISTTSQAGYVATRYNLTEVDNARRSETFTRKVCGVPVNGLPAFVLKGKTFTQQTIEFTGANAPTLASTPTGTVEFVVEDEAPGGSSGQGYVRNNGSTTWVSFTDGQTVTDLAGVSTTGPTYEMRYIATPSTSSLVVPTVRRLGVRELTREVLDGVARIGNPVYQLDPFTLKASIPTLQVELTRDGVNDHRDFATELFSDYHPGAIELRVWYGSTLLNRKDWMHVDQFRLHNYDSAGDAIVVEAVHPLALTKKSVPAGTTTSQAPLVFDGTTDTTQTAYASILNTAGVPGRYRGVLVGTTTTTKVAKAIAEPRPAKEELDRLAFIEGGAVIPSGGRLKWKRIWSSTGGLINSPVAHFDHITPIGVSPNLDRRIVQYRVPFGWADDLDNGRGGFASAVFQQSTSAVSKLGHAALVDNIQNLEAETARWLISDSTSVGSVHAAAIARRTVSAFKQGAVVVSFHADHPQPWLELGDMVEVKTDRLVGRGLESDRALRGRMSVTGPIIAHDMNGTQFSVWVPEIESAIPDTVSIPISYAVPKFTNLYLDYARYPEAIDDSTGGWTFAIDGYRPYANYVTSDETKSFTVDWRRQAGSTSYSTTTYIHSTTGAKFGRVAIGPIVKDSTTGAGAKNTNNTFEFKPFLGTTGTGKQGKSITIRPSTSTIQGYGLSLFDGTTAGAFISGGRLRIGTGLTLDRDSNGFPRIRLST